MMMIFFNHNFSERETAGNINTITEGIIEYDSHVTETTNFLLVQILIIINNYMKN